MHDSEGLNRDCSRGSGVWKEGGGRERMSERESVCVCVYVCVRVYVRGYEGEREDNKKDINIFIEGGREEIIET